MSGSKPEELVAKLYEDGMSDDEVREQLTDFGLSGREIHHLIKKAKKVLDEQGVGGDEEETKKPVVPMGPDPMIQQLIPEKKRAEEIEEEPPELDEGPESPEQEAAPEVEAEAPGPEAEEEVMKEEGGEKEERRRRHHHRKKSKDKKSKGGGLGSKLGGIFKKSGAQKTSGEGQGRDRRAKGAEEDFDYKAKMKRLQSIKQAISQPVSTPGAGSRWAPPEEEGEPPEKPSGGDEAASEEEESMDEVLGKLTGKKSGEDTQAKTLTPEEEEKMDEETVKKLTDGMESLQQEMGEIKQLLDTLRELNIKLIELMEKK